MQWTVVWSSIFTNIPWINGESQNAPWLCLESEIWKKLSTVRNIQNCIYWYWHLFDIECDRSFLVIITSKILSICWRKWHGFSWWFKFKAPNYYVIIRKHTTLHIKMHYYILFMNFTRKNMHQLLMFWSIILGPWPCCSICNATCSTELSA